MSYIHAVLVLALVAVPARLVDPGGTWWAEFAGPGGQTGAETLSLVVKESVVTGTFENAVGGTGAIRDGKWDGKTLTFWVAWDTNDRLQASGTYSGGDTLPIDLKTSQWSARRLFKRASVRK
jgi:hypothetical protein